MSGIRLRLAGHTADFFVIELDEGHGFARCGGIEDGIPVRFEPADPDASKPWEGAPFVLSYAELQAAMLVIRDRLTIYAARTAAKAVREASR